MSEWKAPTVEQLQKAFRIGTTAQGFAAFLPWNYTPADELRDRLNASLQGRPPAFPVNTRYWRNP